ncbi:MAG: TerC family protein [Gemmatimonadaceae bacterium]|nr:TerC family protein [Gemmatimonadaceae bacterium]
MSHLLTADALVGLATLTVLEIVLGIDNIIFISILASALPAAEQPRARRLGLAGAFMSRMALLFSITWIMRLTEPLLTVLGRGISGKDVILIVGGLFLIGKATTEIHHKFEDDEKAAMAEQGRASGRGLWAVVAQITVIDIVFSLDSVITAVGMVPHIEIMIGANIIALCIMLFAAGPISAFVDRHPTVKMLALSFLVLIGTNLVAEGTGFHIPKGYTYFAMAFSVATEMLNIRLRKKADPTR